ncbi:MAG: serine hydrolase domain-containing protein [Myxococcota bacterium]
MMRVTLGFSFVVGCVTPPTPNSEIACDVAFVDHPAAEALQAELDGVVAKGIPGLSLAVRTPDGLWAGAAGMADIEHDVPMNPCHVHPWASVGKTWTALLLLRLVDAGELGLDDRIAELLAPEVLEGLANIDQVTVRQLLNHSSGLKDFNEDLGYLTWEFDNPSGDDPPEQMIDFVRGDPAFFDPGEGYHYTDTSYVLAAMAIETLTGDRNAAMAQEVFGPLELVQTELPLSGGADPAGRVNAYWELPGGQLENVSELQASYDAQVIGAGNLRSTPLESLRFAEAVAQGTLLSSGLADAMIEWNPDSQREDDEQAYAYGLGLQRRVVTIAGEPTTWVGHYGGDIGASAVILARPDAPIGIAAGVNLGGFLGGPLNAHVGDDFIDRVLELASGEP